ncbi:hypothetical protein CGRA01v4_12552 [Colletotrichum graminicola]|nr:hypothetical protein CGRA01v4_12552 [Colletotrichum graminicola]
MRPRETFVEGSRRFGWPLRRCRSPNLAVMAVGTLLRAKDRSHTSRLRQQGFREGFPQKALGKNWGRMPIYESDGLVHSTAREVADDSGLHDGLFHEFSRPPAAARQRRDHRIRAIPHD